jgi:putative endopeptidase
LSEAFSPAFSGGGLSGGNRLSAALRLGLQSGAIDDNMKSLLKLKCRGRRTLQMIMRKTAAILAAAVIGLAAAPAFALGEFKVNLGARGVNSQPTVQEDYYLHQNYDWLTHTKIPATEGRIGAFIEVGISVEDRLSDITKDCVRNSGKFGENSDEARIANLRRCISDTSGRSKAGLGELAMPLKEIDDVKTLDEYGLLMSGLTRKYGVSNVFGDFGVDADLIKADKYRAIISRPDLGLGKELYEQQGIEEYVNAYAAYITKLLTAYGRPREAAAKSAQDIIALQKDIAKHALSKGELYDPSIAFSMLTTADVKKIYSNMKIIEMLNAAGIGPANGADRWVALDRGAMEYANAVYTPDKLQLFKDYAIFNLLNDYAETLPEKYAKPAREFNKILDGVRKMKPRERRDDILCEDILSYTYGRLYAKRYSTEADKEAVTSYVRLVMDEYRRKLAEIDWMSDATKKRALKKLDTMIIRIGRPAEDEWPSFINDLAIKSPEQQGTLISNVVAIKKATLDYMFGRLNKPITRKDLVDLPQVVNAGYNPNDNSINFPAAIMQPPFYDPKASRERNLGAIGTVIAHEITHCFDSNGAQFDEKGAMENWWTDKDYKEFKKRQANIISFYDRYKFSDNVYQNGTLTLTENIADLGSMSCITDIVGNDPAKLRQIYESYAFLWKELESDAMLRQMLADTHSMPHVRVDAVLSSTDGFYKAYDLKPGDPMYVAPKERARLW